MVKINKFIILFLALSFANAMVTDTEPIPEISCFAMSGAQVGEPFQLAEDRQLFDETEIASKIADPLKSKILKSCPEIRANPAYFVDAMVSLIKRPDGNLEVVYINPENTIKLQVIEGLKNTKPSSSPDLDNYIWSFPNRKSHGVFYVKTEDNPFFNIICLEICLNIAKPDARKFLDSIKDGYTLRLKELQDFDPVVIFVANAKDLCGFQDYRFPLNLDNLSKLEACNIYCRASRIYLTEIPKEIRNIKVFEVIADKKITLPINNGMLNLLVEGCDLIHILASTHDSFPTNIYEHELNGRCTSISLTSDADPQPIIDPDGKAYFFDLTPGNLELLKNVNGDLITEGKLFQAIQEAGVELKVKESE